LLNIILAYGIVILVSSYQRKLIEQNIDEKNYSSLLKIIRYWYGIAVILVSFKEIYHIIHSLKLHDWDMVFIKLDYSIFGIDPTKWAYQFANPALTEFLQIVYIYYYLMIVVYGLEIYLWKRFDDFKYVLLVLFTGFFTSYLLYMVFPAVGPRFYLHNFYSISKELPGLLLTEPIRSFINFGESIPLGVSNPIEFVQRDAMPSVHTTIALLITYLSRKIKSKSFYFYLPYSILLVISTIYLRYHYAVDIIAGAIIALAAIFISNQLVKLRRTKDSTAC
jgi:membrane-associated phospholipid phosphatase